MNCIEALKHIVFKQLSEVAKDISMPAYVVGGFVRDFFLLFAITERAVRRRGEC